MIQKGVLIAELSSGVERVLFFHVLELRTPLSDLASAGKPCLLSSKVQPLLAGPATREEVPLSPRSTGLLLADEQLLVNSTRRKPEVIVVHKAKKRKMSSAAKQRHQQKRVRFRATQIVATQQKTLAATGTITYVQSSQILDCMGPSPDSGGGKAIFLKGVYSTEEMAFLKAQLESTFSSFLINLLTCFF
ncbi:MAG: hypothetical protein ACXV2C_00015 [Candidatus Bathyarchaeia archaeon]